MSVLGDKLRCPHCLEELDQLEDPKQLPCTHVFCSPCLASLTKTEERTLEITCSICSKCHKLESIANLPTPKDDTSVQDTNETINSGDADDDEAKVKLERRCDVCKEETTAVCYCVECDKSLCPPHEQVHQEFFGGDCLDHKMISIQTYVMKINFYVKPKCDEHDKECTMSCRKCFRLRCKDCANDGECEKDNEHFYKTMHGIRSQLEAEFAELTQAVSDRMTEMCKLEKETWQKLDNLELECDRLREEVREKTKSMIKAVHDQQDEILARIEKYVTDKRTEVEAHLLELRTQREEMEALRHESKLMIRNSHVTKIIEQRGEMLSQLNEATERNVRKWEGLDLLILEESLKSYLRKSTSLIPDRIELLSSHETAGRCYSTWFREDGQLLVGCHDGLREYSQYGDGHKRITEKQHVTSVARLFEDNLCLITYDNSSPTNIVFNAPQSNSSIQHSLSIDEACLFSYSHPSTSKMAKFLSTSKKYAASTSGTSIQLYDIDKKAHVSKTLDHNVRQLHFLSSDHLITTDEKTMHLYHIENINSMHLVWQYTGLEGARGVCTTESGLIVCMSNKKRVIYILSAQGELLKTLQSEKIQPSWGQISIYRDMLAVACPYQDMFQLFRLT